MIIEKTQFGYEGVQRIDGMNELCASNTRMGVITELLQRAFGYPDEVREDKLRAEAEDARKGDEEDVNELANSQI